ncbi:putative F-box protein PP2-B12 [Gastrolobium bilobum]|uniref:putative F-box protein PP2-B12 n=1 Tax=Gastrolobium bilobum TaxID=150636 RepID=UPI002AB1CDD9|nr:putative F-box protein PP2-B12 [Gastrolobium bilobum]
MELQALPEGCIAHILSYTTPVDVCSLSLISKAFCSAAESDSLWDRFLPSDLVSIISESSSSLLATSSSKKALYLALSDHPIIIDHGTKSFQLERKSGKKCYMLSARDLSIIWGDTPEYWNWITLPGSRFEEVAELVQVCWFEIRGKINAHELSSDTNYAAFLVFKMIDASGFHYCPVECSVGTFGGRGCTKNVCLDPNLEETQLDARFKGLQRPSVRSDGWLEIEMGEFFNSGVEDEEVEMSVKETESNWWKHGFYLQGIEVRPKLSVHKHNDPIIGVGPSYRPRRVLQKWGDKLKNIWNRG